MAVGGSQATCLDDLDQLYLCQICMNPLSKRKPRTLPCLHTFCEKCLIELATPVAHESPTRSKRWVTCPICRHLTKLPSGNVSELPLNFTLEQITEVIWTLKNKLLCDKCYVQREFVSATVKCLVCHRRFCESCKEQHDLFPGFSNHAIEEYGSQYVRNPCCSDHVSVVIGFCNDCNCVLCTDCLLTGDHDDHPDEVEAMETATDCYKAKLSHTQKILKEQMVQREASLRNASARLEQLEQIEKDMLKKLDKLTLNDHVICKDDSACVSSNSKRYARMMSLPANMSQPNQDEFSSYFPTSSLRPDLFYSLQQCGMENITGIMGRADDVTPTLMNRFYRKDVLYAAGLCSLGDHTVVLVSKTGKELIVVDSKGNIVTRYTHPGAEDIISVSVRGNIITYYAAGLSHVFQVCRTPHEISEIRKCPISCEDVVRVCSDQSGHVYVATENGSVIKHDSVGKVIWTQQCNHMGLLYINAVNLGQKEQLLVSHPTQSRVDILDANGETSGKLELKSDSSRNADPRGTTVTTRGTILVADWSAGTVSEYAPTGTFIRHVLTEEHGIRFPEWVSCSRHGNLWVTDYTDSEAFQGFALFKL